MSKATVNELRALQALLEAERLATSSLDGATPATIFQIRTGIEQARTAILALIPARDRSIGLVLPDRPPVRSGGSTEPVETEDGECAHVRRIEIPTMGDDDAWMCHDCGAQSS